MLKKCNNCGFQQDEFLNLGGRNYCKSCNSEINNNSKYVSTQDTLSAYDKQVVQDIFLMTMEVLEKYIERANYYSDWQNRRKIHDNKVTREFGSVEEAESVLSSNLVGLKVTLRNKPPFLTDELKKEYYKWINATGIDISNISPQAERLKHWLFEVNEVLNGKGERFLQEVKKECREHVDKMSNEEYERKMNEAFVSYNPKLNEERKRAKSLEGKTYKDVSSSSKFVGADDERGSEALSRISDTVAGKHGNFDYYQKQNLQHRTNSEIIQDVRRNPQNWRIDEVITGYYNVSNEAKKELALINNSAQIGHDGSVLGNNQPVYLSRRFNQAEIAEINRAKNISQSSASGSNYHYQQKPGNSLANISNQNCHFGKGGIIAIVGIVSALLIGSVIIVKKRLSKKVKSR